jgi:hypothetical protein
VPLREQPADCHRDLLTRARQPAQREGIMPTTELVEGDEVQAIVECIQRNQSDLLVLACTGIPCSLAECRITPPTILYSSSAAAFWAFIKNGAADPFSSEDRNTFVLERLNLLGGPFIQSRKHLAIVRGVYPKRWGLLDV